ncbi:hypothetical protein A1F95_07685 [Pyrenophora tritici-repentis]|nr:hypothetical protein PtrEW7m1_004366 [Pyrenophora tritici-repentis]PZC92932.1 hypothetical protein A1F95_07685 [Pyrenophora tritici-repentis]
MTGKSTQFKKSQELPAEGAVQPIRSDLSEDEEYPGFRRFLRQRPYIIRHGTYFQPSEEPTWDFEKPLFPIIMPNGKTGPYYLIDPPTPPMSPHLPIMLPYDHWRARRVTVFGGSLEISAETERWVTYYEFGRDSWDTSPIDYTGWEDRLVD